MLDQRFTGLKKNLWALGAREHVWVRYFGMGWTPAQLLDLGVAAGLTHSVRMLERTRVGRCFSAAKTIQHTGLLILCLCKFIARFTYSDV